MLHDLAASAANIKQQSNHEYTVDKFLQMYPQFYSGIDYTVVETYVVMANQCVSQQRYGALWEIAVGLLAAHYCTLHMQSHVTVDASSQEIEDAGRTPGVVTSESADGISYSMDTSLLSSDLQGWAAYKLTSYGVQFATIARLKGAGGMYVW